VRLMKRDLLFILERILSQLEERRLEVIARSRGIKKVQTPDSVGKLLSAYVCKAQEGELGALLVEAVILQSVRTQAESSKALKDAALHYKVDTDAIASKVKQEFMAKEKAKAVRKTTPKGKPKVPKKLAAA